MLKFARNQWCRIFLALFFTVLLVSQLQTASLAKQDEITFAMLPQIADTQVYKKWKPLLAFLEGKTGITIRQVFPKDFEEHVALCRKGEIAVAYSNPVTYCMIAPKNKVRKKGHEAFAVAKTANGTRDFYGLIIARKDNPQIKQLTDIKGKSGWIVGWDSAGGYSLQEALAMKNGFSLKTDCQLAIAPDNKQEKVIMAVFNRETDFGCVRNGMLDMVKIRVDTSQIQIVAETEHFPAWTLSVDSRLDKATKKKIMEAFLALPENLVKDADLPGNVLSFSEAGDRLFDPFRDVLDTIKKEY